MFRTAGRSLSEPRLIRNPASEASARRPPQGIAVGERPSAWYSRASGRVGGLTLSINISITRVPRAAVSAAPSLNAKPLQVTMAHEVFIGHASEDTECARRVVDHLEGEGLRCWLAVRDQRLGPDFPAQITRSIESSRCFILLFSRHAQDSPHIANELAVASSGKKPILTVCLDDTPLDDTFRYYLSRPHWLKASPPLDAQALREIGDGVKGLLHGAGASMRRQGPRGSPRGVRSRVLAALVIVAALAAAAYWALQLIKDPPPKGNLVVIREFSYEDPKDVSIPPGSLEYLLAMLIRQGDGNLRLVPAEVFGNRPAEFSIDPPPLQIDGVLKKDHLTGSDWRLTLMTTPGNGRIVLTLCSTSLLNPLAGGDAFADVHAWLIKEHAWSNATPQSGRDLGRYLTREWTAFEKFYRGLQAWDNQNGASAREFFREAVNYDTSFVMARARLAEAASFLGRWDEARAQLLQADSTLAHGGRECRLCASDSLAYHALRAQLLTLRPREEELARKRLRELAPWDPEAAYNLGEVYFHTARWDESLRQYTEALSLKPQFKRALNHRAYCLAYIGDFAAARADLAAYLKLVRDSNEDRANADDSRGDVEALCGNYPTALEKKESAGQAGAPAYMILAKIKVLLLMGREAQARLECQRILDRPADRLDRNAKVDALTYLAVMPYQRGDLESTLSALDCIWPLYRSRSPAPAGPKRPPLSLGFLDTGWQDAVVFRDELYQERWVKPLWLRGLIAYEQRDSALLRSIVSLLDEEVIQPEALGREIYRPACKFHAHLSLLLDDLEDRGRGHLDDDISRLVRDADRWSYWTTYHDRSYFLTALANLALREGLTDRAATLVNEVMSHNPRYVPARWCQADLALSRGDSSLAHQVAAEVVGDLDLWGADETGYLRQGTARLLSPPDTTAVAAGDTVGTGGLP